MQTPTESDALFAELLARAEIVSELDGPQVEAWVSGLFPALDDTEELLGFVDYCGSRGSNVAALVCAAVAELTTGLNTQITERARQHLLVGHGPAAGQQIGGSVLTGAWMVSAPFGRSIVLGFEHPLGDDLDGNQLGGGRDDGDPVDLRHSILAEIDEAGVITDLQLAGAPKLLLDEAATSEDRVLVGELEIADALADVASAWPTDDLSPQDVGRGMAANQQFVRRRIFAASQQILPAIRIGREMFDVQRGLPDDEFARANAAALSTLRAAVGDLDSVEAASAVPHLLDAWVGMFRGDGGELSGRERQGVLWLEWADWLGVGIGLLRGGVGTAMTGKSFVDLVNRCPEVSSTIDKVDREYAEWAFEVAIDVLSDAGVADEGVITEAGYRALHPAFVAAWQATE